MTDTTKQPDIIGERWAADLDALAEGVLIKNEAAAVGFALVRGWDGVPTREQCEEIAARMVVEHNAFGPMRDVLLDLQWSKEIRGYGMACPWCDCGEQDGGHDPNCQLAAALRAADGETIR